MKVSVIGTGLLGAAIAERLLAVGHQVTVWNRTRAKAAALQPKGAELAASAAAALAASPVALTVLLDGAVTKAVLLAEESQPEINETTVVQMGTISVQQSRELESQIQDNGGAYLEAPVLGSTPEAKNGTLQIMAAGARTVFDRQLGLLSDLGRDPKYLGQSGQAASLKLALNQLLVGLVGSFGLSLAMVRSTGVEVDTFMEIVKGSSLRSPQFEKKLPRMLDRDFSDPHFPVTHLKKDIELMLAETDRLDLGSEALQGFRQIVERTIEMGYTSVDYSALYNAIHPGRD